MDPATDLHQDIILHGVNEDINSESPRQDSQKTCTRNSHCLQLGCSTCATPASHVCNLNVSLTNTNERTKSATSLTTAAPQQPPINHAISTLTAAFQLAIQDEDIGKLKSINSLYELTMSSNLNIITYDCTTLRTARVTTHKIITSHTAASTPLPASPPNGPTLDQPTMTPSASFKPPKLVTDHWSGQTYDFYPWLSSILNGFNLTKCDDSVKVVLTLQAIPLNKRGPFIHITNWQDFKICLIEEFGSIKIFGRDVTKCLTSFPGTNQSKRSLKTCHQRSKPCRPI